MTIEERINNDLLQLSAEFHSPTSASETGQQKPSTRNAKNEPDLKNKAARLLDLMISLGEIERRRDAKKSS
jgi:hypothetical protein